jgi:hypothetical protein
MGGIVMAFEKYKPLKGFLGSKRIGLHNFQVIFTMPGYRLGNVCEHLFSDRDGEHSLKCAGNANPNHFHGEQHLVPANRNTHQIYVPLSMPSIAVIALFSIAANWNSFFDGLIYGKAPPADLYSAVDIQHRLSENQFNEFRADGQTNADVRLDV